MVVTMTVAGVGGGSDGGGDGGGVVGVVTSRLTAMATVLVTSSAWGVGWAAPESKYLNYRRPQGPDERYGTCRSATRTRDMPRIRAPRAERESHSQTERYGFY